MTLSVQICHPYFVIDGLVAQMASGSLKLSVGTDYMQFF